MKFVRGRRITKKGSVAFCLRADVDVFVVRFHFDTGLRRGSFDSMFFFVFDCTLVAVVPIAVAVRFQINELSNSVKVINLNFC